MKAIQAAFRVALVALAAAACGSAPPGPSPTPGAIAGVTGQPTKVGMGQAASFDGGRFELGLVEVTEDSRCPADVVCIQAGTGKLRSWVRTSSGRRDTELRTDTRSPVPFDGYAVQVTALEPYPYSNIRIDASQYVATVIVTRR